ncbi:helix-turn-helix domain-containing protein [Oceanobacillus caeni]
MQDIKLKQLRKKEGLTQHELANKIETLTPVVISRIEFGTRKLTLLQEMELWKE